MTDYPDYSQLAAIHTFLARRQDEVLSLICELVEAESPSGDFEGSRAVVDLLYPAAEGIIELVCGKGDHICTA